MIVAPRLGARMASSCSFWIVATTECIELSRARLRLASSAPSPTTTRSSGAFVGVEQVVLDADDAVAGAAQDPAPDDAGGVLGGGLVEDGGRRRAPVDEQDLAVGVAHADAADVAGLAVERG